MRSAGFKSKAPSLERVEDIISSFSMPTRLEAKPSVYFKTMFPSKPSATTTSASPSVSYTHLDVYKRQIKISANTNYERFQKKVKRIL